MFLTKNVYFPSYLVKTHLVGVRLYYTEFPILHDFSNFVNFYFECVKTLPMFKLRDKTMGGLWSRVRISWNKRSNKQELDFSYYCIHLVQFSILHDFLQLCQYSLWVHENFTNV